MTSASNVEFNYARTPKGSIHYAAAGNGYPVVLLHQTPRSAEEYLDVMPHLANEYRPIAMDMVDFGNSYRLNATPTIERYAQGVIDLLDALAIDRTVLVGHHTGGVVAVEVAAAHPERISALVLSSTPFIDAEAREQRKTRPPIDEVEEAPDGSHLARLWQKRMPFYPKNQPDLLARFVLDALKVRDRVEAGHRAVGRYVMEVRVPLIQAPTLLIGAGDDPFALPHLEPLARVIRGGRTVVIPGGMVPLPEQMPEAFAKVIVDFLHELDLKEDGSPG